MQPDSSALDGFVLFFEKLPSDDVMEARLKVYLARERRKIKSELQVLLLDILVVIPQARRRMLEQIAKRSK
jgi:septum formation topological specificity factor MinE